MKCHLSKCMKLLSKVRIIGSQQMIKQAKKQTLLTFEQQLQKHTFSATVY